MGVYGGGGYGSGGYGNGTTPSTGESTNNLIFGGLNGPTNGLGDFGAPPSPDASFRERDIRNDIKARLEATGEFEEAWIPGLEDARGNPASQAYIASVEPMSSAVKWAGDWSGGGGQVITKRVNIRMVVRHEDPIIRDETAERLMNVCRNTLNGKSLATFTHTEKTRIVSWQWQKPISIERRINLVLECDYLDDGWNAGGIDE